MHQAIYPTHLIYFWIAPVNHTTASEGIKGPIMLDQPGQYLGLTVDAHWEDEIVRTVIFNPLIIFSFVINHIHSGGTISNYLPPPYHFRLSIHTMGYL